MGNWVNKHLRKKKTVKVLLFDEGQKQTVHYVIPRGNNITIKNQGTYQLDRKTFFLDEKRFITYVFGRKTVEPVNPFNIQDRAPFSPDEFTSAIDSKVASEILNYSKKSTGDLGLILLAGLIIIGFGLIYYVFNQRLTEIELKITPQIVEVIPDAE